MSKEKENQMKLSAKQIALFGRVRVDLNQIDSKVAQYITLFELYKAGWWVTERFGTIITLVRPRHAIKDGFSCIIKRIMTDINLDSLDVETKQIADRQYEKYRRYLEENRRKLRLKQWKINENNNMSTLPSGN